MLRNNIAKHPVAELFSTKLLKENPSSVAVIDKVDEKTMDNSVSYEIFEEITLYTDDKANRVVGEDNLDNSHHINQDGLENVINMVYNPQSVNKLEEGNNEGEDWVFPAVLLVFTSIVIILLFTFSVKFLPRASKLSSVKSEEGVNYNFYKDKLSHVYCLFCRNYNREKCTSFFI